MRAASGLAVSVKCRLGIDEHDSDEFLFRFVETVMTGGVEEFALHARIAKLQGLSPAQNRSVPPLNYARVARLRARLPGLTLFVNGGLDSVETVESVLTQTGCDGAMIGRAAYQNPWLLAELDHRFHGTALPRDRLAPIEHYLPYVAQQLDQGERLHRITRHMLGIANGMPGARRYRRYLSEHANKPGAGIATLETALAQLRTSQAA